MWSTAGAVFERFASAWVPAGRLAAAVVKMSSPNPLRN